ncbi:MAG: hypothetical protein IJY69_03260 [Clostridia bacterium]|nr:hypothetical protein [Clostridia bacterium]
MENGKKIEKIIESMNQIPDSTLVSKNDSSHEYEFINENVGGGLIFEYGTPIETDDNSAASEKAEESVSAVITSESDQSKKSDREEEKAKPKRVPPVRRREEPASDEFHIPDVFSVDERYDTPATPDTPSRIWTTYVPRFTEASEKYRMNGDPRPRPEEPSENEKTVVKVVERDESSAPTETSVDVDPTAELDEQAEGVVVNMYRPTEDEDSSKLSVFKFSDKENSEEAETVRERTVEDELRDIDNLISPPERNAPAEIVEEESETYEEVVESEPPKIYTIPDPDSDDMPVVDYNEGTRVKKNTVPSPEGVGTIPSDVPKKLSGEFTHQIQRDGFKDRFLDIVMSQKIRLVASAIFLLVLITYETLVAFSALPSTPVIASTFAGAYATYDLLFVVCLFAFALPETVRAFRSLFSGKVVSDLSLTASLLVVTAYSVIVILCEFTDYALFGGLFGVHAVLSILSSYCRTDADFTAFKLISQNKEKRILDKKMTRMLPEENIALDGLVDEYRSRTARLFRAGFITDFFKRSSRTSEKSEHTLLILGVSFGVALVVGGVSFFLVDGLISAISSITLVFLLGIPAFTVLTHKLSYFDAQRCAQGENTTVIGEQSYLDFSDIDVIAFEDTEIFGPDDVNLKRFMLYGDRDNMERAMRQMCSLFSVIGGPLHFIFTNSLDKRVRYSPATDVTVEEDGLSGNISGVRISAGTEDYMRRHGVAIPEGALRAESGIDTTKIMYASEDGEVYAKFYVRYSFSEEFTMVLPMLKEQKVVPLIYTRDPNVSNELLRTLSAGSDCMRVMKRLRPGTDEDVLYSHVSAGVVTYGDKINAIDVVLLTKQYRKFIDKINRIELYSMGAGVAIAAVLSLAKLGALAALAGIVWQLGWSVALRVASYLSFKQGKG